MKEIRFSKQREEILSYLKSVKTHPDANEVYESLKKNDANVSIATVYRNLSFLSEKGDILKIDTGSSKSNYDADISSHHHFVCRHCEKIFDIVENFDLPTDLEIGKVEKSALIFYGTCKNCEDSNS